eukprot:SAG22_NODE_4704_length_1186_cov_3.561178_1_plen_58_part_10
MDLAAELAEFRKEQEAIRKEQEAKQVTKPGGNHMMSPESYGSTPGLVSMLSNASFEIY